MSNEKTWEDITFKLVFSVALLVVIILFGVFFVLPDLNSKCKDRFGEGWSYSFAAHLCKNKQGEIKAL